VFIELAPQVRSRRRIRGVQILIHGRALRSKERALEPRAVRVHPPPYDFQLADVDRLRGAQIPLEQFPPQVRLPPDRVGRVVRFHGVAHPANLGAHPRLSGFEPRRGGGLKLRLGALEKS
jgi:hypothetical protein